MTPRFYSNEDALISSNFLHAIRESGYLSLSTALAELIDNSLQASAKHIAITISRATSDALPVIEVEDNGTGMSNEGLELCLRFGGSSRFNNRQSFGRFGMGLPAASLSQARRVEVSAWQNNGPEKTVCLDIDAVVAGSSPKLIVEHGPKSTSRSGCRVRWAHCDRIEYQRLAWLERSLHRDLGRMYRRFLWSSIEMTINGKAIDPIDPMMLTTEIDGQTSTLAFQELAYELETASGDTSIVAVRFAILPVQHWFHLDNATKRRVGIVGGAGVSILRSGREIANGWHVMGGKRKENYDDWWRCEIEFDPVLDEHFGITINKQGIRPSPTLREAIEPELESIARILNARVRQGFEDAKFRADAETSCKIAEAADRDLPVLPARKSKGALRYRIGSAALPVDLMFRSTLEERTLDLTLNMDHPAFAALYRPLQTMDSDTATELRTAIELLLLSFARSAVQMERSGQHVEGLLQSWSNTYGRMLQKA